MIHISICIYKEFLEGQTADTCNRVKGSQSESRNSQQNQRGGNGFRNAKLGQEGCNCGCKDLRRCTFRQRSTACQKTNTNQRNDCQHALHQHGTKGNRQHIAFVLDLLAGCTGGYQRMETGDCAAGNGNKQRGEQIGAVDIECRKGRQIHRRIIDNDADNSSNNHNNQQIAVQVVTGLKQCPDRNDRGYKDVNKDKQMPETGGLIDRQCKTNCNAGNQQCNGNGCVSSSGQMGILEEKAQADCCDNKQKTGGSNRCICCDLAAILCKSVKCACYNICKGSNNKNREQPAEQQEQLLAQLAHIQLNDDADGVTLILNGGIHGGKILHCTEEYAA